MKHLFIINPVCARIKGTTDKVLREINAVMSGFPQLEYDLYVSRWSRDALGYCRLYVQNAGGEAVRVHTIGGTGTLFEIVNAVVDLPNVQMAVYPMGRTNIFLHYFGKDKYRFFESFHKQITSDTIQIDAIRCNHNYGISSVLIGYEAYVDILGDNLIEKTKLPSDVCYILVALNSIFTNSFIQNYRVNIDDKQMDGRYITFMMANQPWYGENFHPGSDAKPDDGILDFYIMKSFGRLKRLKLMTDYLSGKYYKHPNIINHYSGRKLEISSDKEMWLSIDGETFYGNDIECEILPGAINFVCPPEVLEARRV